MKSRKKMAAVAVVGIIVIAGIVLYISPWSGESSVGTASMDDLLSIRSTRSNVEYDMIIAPYDSPYTVLAATPLAVYYDGNSTRVAKPLLLAGNNEETPEGGVSKPVHRFLGMYPGKRMVVIGTVVDSVEAELNLVDIAERIPGVSPEDISVRIARRFWESSDAALLIHGSQAGYDLGVNALPLACYLNIPVLVTSDTGNVDDTLAALGVKYTLVCGDLEGYRKTMFLDNITEIQDVLAVGVGGAEGMRSIMKDRMGIDQVKYIAMANPLDIDIPEVLAEVTETFTGTIVSASTGSTSNPSSDANAPTHYFTIPEDYTWANIILDSKVQYSSSPVPGRTPEMDGQRSFAYFGVDKDGDGEMMEDADSEEDHLQFFSPSLGYEAMGTCTHGYTEKPIFGSTGEHAIQLLATLHYQVNPYAPPPESTYTITVTAQKLSSPNYPLMESLSCLAPYLAVFRDGMVLAHPEFSIYSEKMLANDDCGDPAQIPELLAAANVEAYEAKGYLNELLARLKGTTAITPADYTALADIYREDGQDPLLVGVIADTNMVPWYYYEAHPTQSHYGSREGYGIPSDNIYSDIDASLDNCFEEVDGSVVSMELGIGRLVGWDTQDVSALLARTFFYREILDAYVGHSGETFRESAMNTFGSQVPVGTSITVTTKLDTIFQHGGLNVDTIHDGPLSDSKVASPVYERSSMIFFCAHGFYYWFVPPGYKDTGVGGGFYPANVNDMNFGPSTIFGSSCVTGKLDGLHPTNAISLSFLHSGMNLYVGASRLSWGGFSPLATDSGEILGAYIGLYLYGYMLGEIYQRGADAFKTVEPVDSAGAALMMAKNSYIEDLGMGNKDSHSDTVEEFNIMGDPAFLPFIPARSNL